MRSAPALVATLAMATLLATFSAAGADDELKISGKSKKQPQAAAPATPTAPAATTPAASPARQPKAITVKVAEGTDPRKAWGDYFTAHPDVDPADVAQTADALMHAQKYAELIAMLEEAICHQQAQPWMYSALELAMEAADSPKEELERALMSAVDFSGSFEDVIYVAQYMATHGLEERAMKVFHQVALMDPSRTEPYVLGLKLANRIESTSDIQWACLGILSQAWPKKERQVEETAHRTALALLKQLEEQGKTEEAAQFRGELDSAMARDCKVVVSWAGDADVDVFIEEPSGTICSYRNPRTTSGGVMLEDNMSRGGKVPTAGYSETYVCPQAFSGQYRIAVRRVWGKVTAGKVNIDIYTHFGTKQLQHGRFQLPVGDQDSAGAFQLTDGRRTESLDDRRLATAVETQLALNQAVADQASVTQQLNYASENSSANASFKKSQDVAASVPAIQAQAGYQPVIVPLPSGAHLNAMAVISADRRYVRVTPMPFFSSIGQVTTFNLSRGTTGSSNSSATSGAGTGGGFGS